ncbi:MAG: ABC transporter ATP-binding protein [Lachnospiraceae bacterium]|nr:ABC transporter ATP-binding protein [Lachnospiraceae bacterium]
MLEVKDLKIEFYDHSRPETAVRDVDFTMEEGEIIGLVGESGSGKSLTATAIAGLIRRGDVKISGEVLWDKKEDETIDLLRASRKQMRALQGNEIGFIFQDPMTAFSPVHKIGYQVEDALRVHGKSGKTENPGKENTETGNQGKENKEKNNPLKKKKEEYTKEELKEKALKALAAADLPDPERVYNSYPFELSGGMRQRAMIASAMISSPRLLIADEPTTALDVTVQAEIIKLLKRINEKNHTAILFISHDLGLVRKLCSKVIVLKDGDVVENGSAEEIFSNPTAEYTKKLIAAEWTKGTGLVGHSAEEPPRVEPLKEEPPKAEPVAEESTETESVAEESTETELTVRNYSFYYPAGKNRENLERIGIRDINVTVRKGEIVGLVGESGSGKSTLAKCIVGLLSSKEGEIIKGKVGMVFQDSYSALNPKMRVFSLLRESLRLSGIKDKEEQKSKINKITEEVELPGELLERYPAELSGGQRQRVMIAMALLQQPTLLVADEPVSALDVAIQESILKLLKKLSDEHNMAILFISHDLRTVYTLCDKVLVMQKGVIVETADKEELFRNPKEEYTKLLLKSALE